MTLHLDSSPAHALVGLTLPGDWRVVRRLDGESENSVGQFSCGYLVQRPSGERAFLKAIDILKAMERHPGRSMMDQLAACTHAYRHERDLLARCGERRLSRVIRVLDSGEVDVPGYRPLGTVPYLIVEHADGDVREFRQAMRDFDAAWALRTLHHVTTGLKQLHGSGVTHQDLKPGNVLTQEGGAEMKLGDLGCAMERGVAAPHEDAPVPGTFEYAPPEQLYGSTPRDWEARRAADLYQLGSLAVYLFTDHNMTALIRTLLPATYVWGRFRGDYASALPAVRQAFSEAMDRFQCAVDHRLRRPDLVPRLVAVVAQLCEPDPRLRGHPKTRAERGSPYGLQRFEAEFNLLATHAARGISRGR